MLTLIRRLVVASEYDPFSIIERLVLYLGGSASLVVYSPHLQVILMSYQFERADAFILLE